MSRVPSRDHVEPVPGCSCHSCRPLGVSDKYPAFENHCDDVVDLRRPLGVKHRKLARFDLIPPDVLWEVAEVLGWGASNRGDQERNWEQGLVAGDLISGLFRHVSQWASGEQEDEETGRSHLAHAICLLMFLRGLEMRGRLVDDRSLSVSGPLRSEVVDPS